MVGSADSVVIYTLSHLIYQNVGALTQGHVVSQIRHSVGP